MIDNGTSGTGGGTGGEGGRVTPGSGRQLVLHNQSFSEEEDDELLQFTSPQSDDGVDPDAKFNRSWIRYVCGCCM